MRLTQLIIATVGVLFTTGVMVPTSAVGQTPGMEHRDDRRDTRQESRSEKAACKAGDEKTRAECRQDKRNTKQAGRRNKKPDSTQAGGKPADSKQPDNKTP